MGIVGYVVIGIVILFLIVFYLGFMFAYIAASKSYKMASRTNAVILEVLEEMELATGSVTPGRSRHQKYGKYKVSIYVNGEEFIREAELKSRKLKAGDSAEVRYSYNKKGELELESEALVSWFTGMFWASTAGLILALVLALLKYNGFY